MPVYIFLLAFVKLKRTLITQIVGYTHQALFETLNLTLKLKIFFKTISNENIEGFKAV
jgi:hypothetical protein